MIIDPPTSWFVTTPLPNKESETVAIAFDQQRLSKDPRPLQFIHDNGTEFVGIEFQEMLASYGIQAVITTMANP
jgi:transposase InsO family protein